MIDTENNRITVAGVAVRVVEDVRRVRAAKFT